MLCVYSVFSSYLDEVLIINISKKYTEKPRSKPTSFSLGINTWDTLKNHFLREKRLGWIFLTVMLETEDQNKNL